jgi:3-carboxy-cis,cis-muconate cycloisomerase
VTSRITDALGTTDALTDIFADASAVQAMLDVEAALARAQSALGVIPGEAGAAITRAAVAGDFDAAALARAARASGTVAIPLVSALTARVRSIDPDAARFVHWGATSQDIVDTALVLLLERACAVMEGDHEGLTAALRALSDRHAGDVMLGRTLLQPAPPITFGLKVAGWFAAEQRSWTRVQRARRDAIVLQFGGASGTLAALDEQGLAVAAELARELGLSCPDAPWHAHRDRLAALVAAWGIHAGVLGKMARDISLLMQFEISEAREPGGASSTMPHKQNPAGCVVALAAASRLPGLTATAFFGLVQEHERSVGAWHAEWPTTVDACQATGAALAAMRQVAIELTVDPARMRANLDATNGAVFTERVMMRAAPALGRDVAHALLKDALAKARASGASLGEALRGAPAIAGLLSDDELRSMDDPHEYLGAAETLRRRLLTSAGPG